MAIQATAEYELDAERHEDLRHQLRSGFEDLFAGLRMWQLWMLIGWNDIRERYRRSLIGPFWITLSMAIFTVLLGVIYSFLFQRDIAEFLPYVAMGLVAWGFVSGTMGEACGVFAASAPIIVQIKLPFSVHLLRGGWRNFIILLHTMVLIVPIWIFSPVELRLATLLVLPGLLLVFANQLWMAAVISVFGTRYRDLQQLVMTAIQILMFATPIMWPVDALGHGHLVATLNPFFHLISLIREPLLGKTPAMLSYLVVIAMCGFGYVLAAYLLSRARRRLVYWL